MPKLRQIDSLQKMGMDTLLNSVLKYCQQNIAEISLDEFSRGICVIKQNIMTRIPWSLLAEFANKFLDQFFAIERADIRKTAAIELILDTEIQGLRIINEMMPYLDRRYFPRVNGLTELNLVDFLPSTDLEKFPLQDVTVFQFEERCTDDHLIVIGRNCLKLEVLKIRKSSDVTDKGLFSVKECSELRVLDVVGCSQLTHTSLLHILSTKKKLQEFSYGYYIEGEDNSDHPYETDFLHSLDWAPKCESVKRFVYNEHWEGSEPVLDNIVKKFPNLTNFRMNCAVAAELIALRSLNQLAVLHFYFAEGIEYDDITEAWYNITELLPFIGANLTSLKLTCYTHLHAGWECELDVIFRCCPNLEYLEFDHELFPVDIPSFQKLKTLRPRVNFVERDDESNDPSITFNELPNLEILRLSHYRIDFERLKSMILDHVTFPKLSLIEICGVPDEDLEIFDKIIRDKNLDLKIKNYPFNGEIFYKSRSSNNSESVSE